MKIARTLARAGLAALLLVAPAAAEELVVVDTVKALHAALEAATAGTTIELAPGTYEMQGGIRLRQHGSPAQPIRVRAAVPGTARLEGDVIQMLNVTGSHWHFEGLDFEGGPRANHALHIVGAADGTTVRGNRFHNFHAAIKGNGTGEARRAPSDVTIERNVFFNDDNRETALPVTPIDVVNGQRWHIIDNFIADFGKLGGTEVAHGAFLKGGSEDGVFDGNMVICEWRHSGGQRVGISFGGGGTPRKFNKKPFEHRFGRMTNNIILNCSEAPGVYLNKSAVTLVAFNTIYRSFGIDARFPATSAVVTGNLLTGEVLARRGATVEERANLATGMALGYYLPGAKHKLVRRISDYHLQFPSYVDEADVLWAQARITDVFDWFIDGWPGLGLKQFRRLVRDPANGDFRLVQGDDVINGGDAAAQVANDFCDRPRLMPPDLGAIEYEAGPCDVEAHLKARHAPFLDDVAIFPLLGAAD